MNKVSVILLINILLSTYILKAQDVHFSQYRETPMLINPGQTALNKDVRIELNYKDQWRSFVSPYKTFAFSAELNTAKKKKSDNYIGVGIQLFSDKAGDSLMGIIMGSLNVSGVIKLDDRDKLSLGIMGGFGQRTVNYSNLQWENQYTGSAFNASAPSGESQGSTSYTYPDAGAGLAWAFGKDQMYISANNGIHSTVGISAFHFGLPKYSFYNQTDEKLTTKFIAHGNIEFGLKNTSMIIAPELFYIRQGAQQEILVGSMFKRILQEASKYTGIKKSSLISLGVDYRVGDAIVTTIMYEYSNYAIGISYDSNISSLKTTSYSRGGLEVSLHFVAPNPFGKNAPSL